MSKKMFAGGNTPLGFYSYYYDILDRRRKGRLYILKGGSGVGKGTFIKLFAKGLEDIGEEVTYYYCSGDSESLDGAYSERLNIAMIDGTAPHAVDPILPGIFDEIVNLGVFLSHDKLVKNKSEIQSRINKKAEKFKLAYELLSAAEKLDNIEKYYYKKNEKEGYASLVVSHILEKYEMSDKKEKEEHESMPCIAGRIKHSFSRAITPDGVINHGSYERQYYNVTELTAESETEINSVLSILAEALSQRGIDVELYHNPMRPLETIAMTVPSTLEYYCRKKVVDGCKDFAKLARCPEYGEKNYILAESHNQQKFGENSVKKNMQNDYCAVDIRGITDDSVREGRDIIHESEKLKNNLIALAVENMADAKKIHKGIEKYYVEAMDWNALEEYRKRFLDTIFENAKGGKYQ